MVQQDASTPEPRRPSLGQGARGRVRWRGASDTAGPAAASFTVATADGDVPILNVARRGTYHRESLDDRERCEYFVPVDWL